MQENIQARVDVSRGAGELKHRWNYIGYDECNYTHSPGGTALIRKIGALGRPFYIRTHHLLCTGKIGRASVLIMLQRSASSRSFGTQVPFLGSHPSPHFISPGAA